MDTVLIVEDNRAMAESLSARFTDDGTFLVHTVGSHKDLVELFKTRRDFMCAVVDLGLPDSSRGEAANFLLECDIPTVVYTGVEDDELCHDLANKGIADYVLKQSSASIEQVYQLVKRFLRNREDTVLVVDDSQSFRQLMVNYLQRHCFKTLEAENGIVALKTMMSNPGIKLIVTDCYMDEMDGFDLTHNIRSYEDFKGVKIIGVSGRANSIESAKIMKLGADDFIAKPFSPEEFYCRINSALEQYYTIQALEEASQKKNQLIGMVAHDIKGPLSSMMTIIRMLKNGDVAEDKYQSMFDVVSRSGEDILTMVTELLELSTIESGRFKVTLAACDLVELIREVIALNQNHAKRKRMRMELSMPDNLICYLDKPRIKQVMSNLLSNALKYSPEGGRIKVIVDKVDNDIAMHVKDEGPGIPEGEEKWLFEAFRKLSNKTTGGESSTGLGLAICKQIIEAHKGTITYVPVEGGGSDFSITLPDGLEHHENKRPSAAKA